MEILRFGLSVLAWPLAAGALAASLAAMAGRFSTRLDALSHLAPIYLAAAVVALALAGLGPRGARAPLALTAAFGVMAAASLLAPEWLGRTAEPRLPPDASGQLKIVQFNAWGGNARGRAAVDWLVRERPDIIVSQEDGRIREGLAANGYVRACAECAVGIWARRPPAHVLVPQPAAGLDRYVAAATYADPRGEFTVVGVHRYWPVRFALERRQAAELETLLRGLPRGRRILAGDFNSTPWSAVRRREDVALGLIRRTWRLPTWPAARVSHNRLPAPFPYLPIDHVYADAGWATVDVRRGPRLGSDHYPVVVVLAPQAQSAAVSRPSRPPARPGA